MYYSKEEIELKRLQAIQRRKERESLRLSSHSINSVSSISNVTNKYSILDINSSSEDSEVDESYQNKHDSPLKGILCQSRYDPLGYNSAFTHKKKCEIKCCMISMYRFSVDTSFCNIELENVFKTIPTGVYDVINLKWNFHIKHHYSLKEKIKDIKSLDITFKAIPYHTLKIFKNHLNEVKNKKTINLSSIDAVLINSLYSFQKEGVEFGISKNGRCLIADEMGLGKTRQALGIACYYKKNWPLIIITPSSVRYQWSDAIRELLPSVPVQSVQHILSSKDIIEECLVTIVSYDLLSRIVEKIARQKFGVLICDESHYLKNSKTQRTKAVQHVAAGVKNIILLSGTPALAKPAELYCQLKMLMPNFMSYREYRKRYCEGYMCGSNFSDCSNSKELGSLLKASCLIRRLKKDVMSELPSKIRQRIILDPSTIQNSTERMEAAANGMRGEFFNRAEEREALLEYYSVTSEAKQQAVCNFVADLLECEQKFLIFAHHHNMLDAICQLLESKNIMFIRIDGKTKPERRKYYVDSFQNNEKILVAVLSITAASTGITLTEASLVVFAELYWTPGTMRQAEDRVHRIGQSDNVVIYYLIGKDTADDYIWPILQRKVDVLKKLGLDQNFDLDEDNQLNQSTTVNEADASEQSVVHQEQLDSFTEVSLPRTYFNAYNAINCKH